MYSAQDIYISMNLLYEAKATFACPAHSLAESPATSIRNTSSVNAHFELASVHQVYCKQTVALAHIILEVSETAGKNIHLFRMKAFHFSKKPENKF